jgi:hypothetical protein
MSHLSTHTSKVNDIDSIKDACNELGLVIKTGGKPRYYAGTQGSPECAYVISWKDGRYDVGVQKDEKTGSFRFVYDEYTGEVEKKLGKHCSKLVQSATYHKIAKKAKGYGYFIQKKEEKGKIQMTLSRF